MSSSTQAAQVHDESEDVEIGSPADAKPVVAWLKAKMLFGRPVQAMNCVVIYITHREARIIAWPGVQMPPRIHLLLPGEATAYEADVVGSSGYQFDLRLLEEIPIEGASWRAGA